VSLARVRNTNLAPKTKGSNLISGNVISQSAALILAQRRKLLPSVTRADRTGGASENLEGISGLRRLRAKLYSEGETRGVDKRNWATICRRLICPFSGVRRLTIWLHQQNKWKLMCDRSAVRFLLQSFFLSVKYFRLVEKKHTYVSLCPSNDLKLMRPSR